MLLFDFKNKYNLEAAEKKKMGCSLQHSSYAVNTNPEELLNQGFSQDLKSECLNLPQYISRFACPNW